MQNTTTRIAVRMRDRCCLVTGQAAVKRARGGNFTGLEVAHIFPLLGVGNVGIVLLHEIHSSHFSHAAWMDSAPVRVRQGTSTNSSGCRSSSQCYSSPSRYSQSIRWLSVEHMGKLNRWFHPILLLFNICGSLRKVYPKLFASKSRVLRFWNNTTLQTFDHQAWVPPSHVV